MKKETDMRSKEEKEQRKEKTKEEIFIVLSD